MKKNFKRWIAFLLAVVLIAGTCIHFSDAFLWAEGEDMPVTPPQEEVQQEMTVASDAADVNFLEDEGGDGENFDDEEDIENDDENLGDDDGENDIENEDDGSGNEGEDTEEGEGEDADSEEIADGENGNPGDDSNGSNVEGEDVNEESKDGSEEKGTLSYTIYFYYDGKEDESARISGTDGKPDASILGSLTIEGKKEYDGKNYILERIDNKDGVITEDAGSNVVSVYYVLADEGKKPEEKYGYEIHFYYDGREGDVKKGEEVSGKEILASVTIEDEKEFGGKNYILDSIENENGIISKDTEKNVVNVYYVPAKEDVKTYSLKFESNLSEGGKAEVISVSPDDGKTGSVYKKDAKVTFEVSVNDGYELLSVENQDGELKARSAKGNAYTYAVTMTEDMVIVVTYEEMPAQVLTADDGTVAVTIDAPKGVLPNGTVAEVQSVDSDDVADVIMSELAKNELYPTEIKAVDITLLKDGQKISPKGDVTVTLDNVFDTDIPGKETAVYYINGGSAVDVKADPTASGVTFTTNHFSTYAAVKAVPMSEIEDGIMTLNETGTVINRGNMGVSVKDIFILTGEMNGYDKENGEFICSDHNWIYDESIVSLEKQYENYASFQYVNGEKEREKETVIQHTYKRVFESKDGEKTEICTEIWRVQFTGEIGEDTQRVYVYVHVGTGIESSEWPVNGRGWITVGYVDVPGILSAEEAKKEYNGQYDDIQKTVIDNIGNLVKFGNIQFELDEVTWEGEYNEQKYGLKVASGADNYDEARGDVWHLDGYVTLEPQTFTVEYYKDSGTEPQIKEVTKYIGISADKIPVGENDIKNPFGTGYELEGYKVGNGSEFEALPATIEIGGTIRVYYKTKSQPCKVVYILNGGEIAKEELEKIRQEYEENVEIGQESITFSVKTGDDTPIIAKPNRNGYIFKEWTPEFEKTVTGNAEYEAQYERDKKGFKAAFADGETVVYDTQQHKVNVKVDGGLADGETVFYQYDGKWCSEEAMEGYWPKNVGTYQIPVKVVDEKNNVIWETDGKTYPHPSINITPCPVIISIDNDTQEYKKDGNYTFEKVKVSYKGDGSAPLKPEIEKELGGLGIDLSVKRISEEKKVGTYPKDLTLKNADALKKYSNYSFKIDEGVFTITDNTAKEALSVTLSGQGGTYDGKWHLVKPTVLLEGKALDADEYKITYYGSDGKEIPLEEAGRKNVGESTIYCEVSVEGYKNSAISDKITVEIEPREVDVEVTSTEKIYGEDEPIGNGATPGYAGHSRITNEQLAEGEGLNDFFPDGSGYFTITRLDKGEDVGKYTLSITEDELGRVNPNYKVTVKNGTFEIKGEVKYNSNGAEGNPPQDDSKGYSLGDKITVLDKGSLKKEKAVFLGWSTDAEVDLITTKEDDVALRNRDDFYVAGSDDKLEMGSKSIELYPVWAEDKDCNGTVDYEEYLYSLTYHLNGGSGEVLDGNKYRANQEEVELQQGDPTKLKKEGAVFIGWSKSQYETPFESQPKEGIVIDKVTFKNSDITVYAVWAEDTKGPDGKSDDVADYLEKSVIFKTDMGTIDYTTDANRLYPVGESVTVSAPRVSAPKKGTNEIISFANQWQDVSSLQSYNSDGITFEMPDRDVTLKAQWKHLQIEKTIKDESTEGYKADDPITFIITVINAGDVDFEAVVKEDSKFKFADGQNTQTLSVPEGKDAKVEVNYLVTEDDLRNTLSNTVTAEISGSEGEASFTKNVNLIGATKGLSVEKEITNKKDSYAEGDEITFAVKVKNTGSVTATDINITDSFEEAKLEEANLLKRFMANVGALLSGKGWGKPDLENFDLKPGEEKEVHVKYTLSNEDIRNNASGAVFKNHVIATGKVNLGDGPDEVKGEKWSDEIVIAPLDEKLQLTKSVVAPDDKELVDGKYPVGSSVKYRISIQNLGNVTISKAVIDDSMVDENGALAAGTIGNVTLESQVDGVTVDWDASGRKFEVSQIPRRETITFTYEYKVDDKDAGRKISNTATIHSPEEQSASSEIEIVNKELSVEKSADNPKEGEKYQLGETINYTVTVKNTGNVALSDIKVADILTGGNSKVIPAEGQSDVIELLDVGAEQVFHYTYTVVEDDLENTLENKAVAYVDSKEFTSNLVQSEVEEKTETAALEKNITNLSEATGDNGRFKAGDTIHYEIKVENTGTRTLHNVVVTDTMTGMFGEISNVTGTNSYSQNGSEIKFEIAQIPSKGIDKDADYTGHIATITYDYVVQDKDAGAEISNTAVVSSTLKEPSKPDDEKVTIEKKSLVVTKEIVAVRPDGEAGYQSADSSRQFSTGDTVRFAVKVKNDGNTDLTNVTVTDTMSGENNPVAVFVPEESDADSQTIASLKAGEELTLTFDYTIRPEDISSNNALVNHAEAVSGDVKGQATPVSIQRAGKVSSYTVEKKIEPENPDRMYQVGETIPYSIEVLNTGNTAYPAGEVVVADVLDGNGKTIAVGEGAEEGCFNVTSGIATWDGSKFILNVPLGWRERVRIDYTYKVAPEDEGKELVNTAYGSEMKQKDSAVPVTIEQKKLTVTKEVTNRPADNTYAVGDEIEFKVTLKNDGNASLNDIYASDVLWSVENGVPAKLVPDENPFVNLSLTLEPLESATYTYKYKVKEEDLGKEIYNEITAGSTELRKDQLPESVKTDPVKVENPDPKVSLTKSISTSTPPDGEDGRYKTGTTVTYEIRVKNTGNTTLNNVTVKDTMVGAVGQINAESVTGASMTTSSNSEGKWEYTFEIDNEIARGEEKVITYDYVIQKEDAGKKIGNTVTVDGDNITTDDDSDDSEEIVVENRKLTVTKTARPPKDGIAYRLGEEIIFDVKVDNEGDVTLSGINLVDEMLGGAAGMAELVEGIDPGFTLVSQEAEDFVYKYVVQPGDIIEGTGKALKNKLTATSIDGTKGEDETDYLKIEGANPAYSILKGIPGTDKDGDGKYAIGEDINYEITIFNDGNVALPYMTVEDRMENASGAINADSVKATIETAQNEENNANVSWNSEAGQFELTTAIPIGGKAVITYNYKVVEGDAGKIITNIAAGKGPGEGAPSSKETVAQVEDRRIEVEKVVTSTPDNPTGKYVLGNNILFDVTVKNPGDVAVSGINITDAMQGAIGTAVLVDEEGNALNDGSDENISLQAGEERVLHYSYTVQREDIVAGGKDIANTATATASPGSESLSGKTEDTTTPVQVDRLHTLTVNYQYADGSIAAQTLTQDFAYGESFAFTIPSIAGYTSTLEGNPVQQSIMFVSTLYNAEDDPVFTIIYNAVPATEPTPEPGTEPSATPTPGGGEPAPADDTPDTPVPPTPPVPPVDDGPLPEAVIVPVAPAAVAAAPGILGGGAGLVAIGDEPVPLDGVITQDDDGNIEIVPVDEVEIPLADRELDDHKCCILSFLLMLATLIIYSWFTHSMKKRQKKLAELKDQLAEETLKRQLGITDTKNSAR